MYNQHVNPCYYGVNNELLAETSNQAQNQPFVATNNAYPCVSTTSHAQQILSSPPFEQQAEVGWYNQETSYYQQQPQLGHDFNALSCSFGHNDLTSPQELVLFNLLQDRQQQQPHICYQKNQLIQHDEQDSSLNEWALANANQVDICAIKHSNGLLPLSPMSMQSADNFDSSPIMGGASFSHRMYPQTNPSLPSHLSPSPLLSAATQGHYHHHQLIFNNCHPDMFASEAVANKSIQLQEIAQMQYQQQQEQVYQIKEIKQEDYSTFDKQQQQQQQQQQQPKQCKKTTRRRASRSQLQCTTCFKTFSRPYNLKSHQRTHTKERPFQCLHPDCGWTFARPHDLKRHELLHSGIKPFACVCGKRFARSDAYKRHQSVDINCAISTMPQPRKRQPTSSNTTKNNTL